MQSVQKMSIFGSFDKLTNYIIYIAAAIVALIFSQWDFALLLTDPNCCQDYGYLQHDFYFYPYISVFVSDIIRKISGIYGVIFIGQILLPTLSFILIVKIFDRELSKLWSIAIGFVAIISFSNYPFRDFLMSLINNPSGLEIINHSLPEIMYFPVPSFSVFIFLLTFYYATKLVNLSIKRITFFTIIWSLQFYVNALDALFGICFWFTYFSIRLIKQQKDFNLFNLLKSIFPQLLVFISVIIPALVLANFSSGTIGDLGNFNISFYYTAYFAMPLLLMASLFIIHKIDYQEIIYKFWPVYNLMMVEFILVSIAYFFGAGVNLEILTSRISLFFLHFYYYLPIVFYASRNYYTFHLGRDGSKAANYIRKLIFFVFNKLSNIYLPIIIFLIILFAIVSANSQ